MQSGSDNPAADNPGSRQPGRQPGAKSDWVQLVLALDSTLVGLRCGARGSRRPPYRSAAPDRLATTCGLGCPSAPVRRTFSSCWASRDPDIITAGSIGEDRHSRLDPAAIFVEEPSPAIVARASESRGRGGVGSNRSPVELLYRLVNTRPRKTR